MRRGVVMRAHHAKCGLTDRIQKIVVEHVAGADESDSRLAQSALGELLQHSRTLSGWDKHEQGIGLGVFDALKERRVVGTAQWRAQRIAPASSTLGESLDERLFSVETGAVVGDE